MRLIDGDAVKERFKNDISGMEERKEKETNMLDRMEILSQLSFARYAYAVSIKEPTVPAITLDRIKEAREEIKAYCECATDEKQIIAFNSCLMVIDKLIEDMENANE